MLAEPKDSNLDSSPSTAEGIDENSVLAPDQENRLDKIPIISTTFINPELHKLVYLETHF